MIEPGNVVVRYVVPERVPGPDALRACREVLSADELRRFERLVRPADQRRFVVSRALVRRTLSEQAPVEPTAWRFEPGAQGRPEVIAPVEGATLRFSLSHTRGMSVCALTVLDDVGVDVERADRDVDVERIARRMFSSDEAERLSRMEAASRPAAFLRHWTLREAWVKARGEGMLRVPREAVSFRPGGGADEPVEARFFPQQGENTGSWRFFLRELEGTHLCAVAIRRAVGSPVTLSVGPAETFQPSGSSSSPA